MEYTHRDSGTHATLTALTVGDWFGRLIGGNPKAKHVLKIGQFVFLPATGQKTVVSDSDQTLGQDVLTEPPDELLV